MPTASACQSRKATSTQSGFFFRNDATCVGTGPSPDELEVGCAEPELDVRLEGMPDEVDPPDDERPLDPLTPVPPALPPRQERADDDEDDGRPNASFGSFACGTASESRETSPRMCSTCWAGTPGGGVGWVNTRCTPVAVTFSSAELFVVANVNKPFEPVVWSFEPVGVVEPLPVEAHEPVGPVEPV